MFPPTLLYVQVTNFSVMSVRPVLSSEVIVSCSNISPDTSKSQVKHSTTRRLAPHLCMAWVALSFIGPVEQIFLG